VAVFVCAAASLAVASQNTSGTLLVTVRDQQGAVVPNAKIRISSPALIGGPEVTSDERGQARFLGLPPGFYELEVASSGFSTHRENQVEVRLAETSEKSAELKPAGHTESVIVAAASSGLETRQSGSSTRFVSEYLRAIPYRRSGVSDLFKSAPGMSPTSPSNATINTVSAFGSGTTENSFYFDGTNFTTPINGIARTEPGIDFIQEVQVQSVGASAEYGNAQGAVFNVITKQGSNRLRYEGAYYGQPARLTSTSVHVPIPAAQGKQSAYNRARYRDFTTSLGGPVLRDRIWFFTGYQYYRDYDSQPGTDPLLPRKYEQDKLFAKVTSRLAPAWQLVQSMHQEFWVNPQRPTASTPYDATGVGRASVPAVAFGNLTHTGSSNTMWEFRAARVVYSRTDESITGEMRTNRFDENTKVTSGGPGEVGTLWIARTNAAATMTRYRPSFLGGDHEWKTGVQLERGAHETMRLTPTGHRFIDRGGKPYQLVSREPSAAAGRFVAAGLFASDAMTIADRVTINAGLRFDHTDATSQDVQGVDSDGQRSGTGIKGAGLLYRWNIVSPRLGLTAKVTADGRTVLRASYGRFSQGVATGELSSIHPGQTPTFYTAIDPRAPSRVDDSASDLRLDRNMQAPRTDEYSVSIDREVSRQLSVALGYVRKHADQFIAWADIGGEYQAQKTMLPDGVVLPVFVLINSVDDRLFVLTNPPDYSMRYDGLVMSAEKRRSNAWQARGSYTYSRAAGLVPSSGTTAAGAQVSTVAPPEPLAFGRDPNDLTNARGRLANDRPHVFRLSGTADVPRTGLAVALNLQRFSGKPWARAARLTLTPQIDSRILLETRGSRRLPSQTLLDLRLSKSLRPGTAAKVELLLDVLNALNDASEEGLVTDLQWLSTTAGDVVRNPDFAKPNAYIDPRRAMLSVRVTLGR
jgi:hypothetical protein